MQVIVEVPYVLVQTTYYTLLVYAMLSFEWTAAKFVWFYFVTFFSFLYFTYYGMMTVSITPNHQVAAIFAAAFYSLFNLFSGFFIPRPVSSCIKLKALKPKNDLVMTPFSYIYSENSKVVDMVLLDLPCCMDSLWTNHRPIRRCADYHYSCGDVCATDD